MSNTLDRTALKNSFVKDIKYRSGVIAALEAFKSERPYKGTKFERLVKLEKLHKALSKIYGFEAISLQITLRGIQKGWHVDENSCGDLVIAATPKAAVWSYLYAFSELIFGDGEDVKTRRNRVRWSLNLYRRAFPKMFEKLVPSGNMLLALLDAQG